MTPVAEDAPWPVREIRDPRELRALAHPVRIALLDILVEGPLTATQCAERLGETPANCSYHLRQLARYGHVVEAQGGQGRERPWKAREEGITWSDGSPATAAAGQALGEVLDQYRFDRWHAYRATLPREEPAWRQAAIGTDVAAWMTPDELEDLQRRMLQLFAPYAARDDHPEERPAASRAVRFFAYAWGEPR